MTKESKPTIDTVDRFTRTALMNAAIIGDNKKIKSLLSEMSDINFLNTSRRSALLYAVDYMHEHMNADTIKILVEAGANVNARDWCGRTPLLHLNRLASKLASNPKDRKKFKELQNLIAFLKQHGAVDGTTGVSQIRLEKFWN